MTQINKVGILGSGIMGSGLAEVAARAGFEVVVRSRSKAAADAMVASIDKGFVKAIEKGRSTEEERAAAGYRVDMPVGRVARYPKGDGNPVAPRSPRVA